jgi:hypothetical protein
VCDAVEDVDPSLVALIIEEFLLVLEAALLDFEEVDGLVDFELAEGDLLREVLDALLDGLDVVGGVLLLHHAADAQQSVSAG